MTHSIAAPAALIPSTERRLFDRFRIECPARFMANGLEHDGARLLDVSAAGAALRARRKPSLGEEVVVYAEAGVRLAGKVVRLFAIGFAIRFEANAERLQRLLVKLGLASPGAQAASIIPETGDGPRCRRSDGTEIEGRVIAVSVVGVTIESRERPAIGTPLCVGKADGSVVRHTRTGFMVDFDAYWETASLNNRMPKEALRRR